MKLNLPQFNSRSICCLLFVLFSAGAYSQAVRYVKPQPSGSGNGDSWANASADIQEMINASSPGDTVFVAAGTYIPNRKSNATSVITVGNRDNSFVLKQGVALYGGFTGTESTLGERNLSDSAGTTILSGDLSGNDLPNSFVNNTDNAHHVVIGAGNLSGTRLDGFTIKAGNANGNNGFVVNGEYIARNGGAGLYLSASSPVLANLNFTANTAYEGAAINMFGSASTLTNSIFTKNVATNGAAIYAEQSPYTATNCTFIQNETNANGGAIYLSDSDAKLNRCAFTANKAIGSSANGGAISAYRGNPTFSNSVFTGNEASRSGGAVQFLNSSGILSNVLMYANTAQLGGAVATVGSSSIFDNVTLAANNAASGGALHNDAASAPIFRNSIVYANSATSGANIFNVQTANMPTFKYSIVEGTASSWASIGVNGGNNSAGNPLFVNPSAGDYHLQAASPAINTGSNAFVTYNSDLDNVSRVRGTTVDRGAYEYQNGNTVTITEPVAIVPDASGIVYVKPTAAGNGDGHNWANATADLQAAAVASGATQVWIAGGTFVPQKPAATPLVADPDNRNNAFVFKNGLFVAGGFAGTETTLSQRNLSLTANTTTLSGNIGSAGVATDNCYHVAVVQNATLDGVTVSGGYANASGMYNSISQSTGGGIIANRATVANVTLKNNYAINGGGMYADGAVVSGTVFTTNTAMNGAGVYSSGSNSKFTGVTFSANAATGAGGAAYSGAFGDSFTTVSFQNNSSSSSGGGLYVTNPGILTGCQFTGNTASSWGGAMYIAEASPKIINTSITENTAPTGAAIYNTAYNTVSAPVLVNLLIAGNTGVAVHNIKSAPIFTNVTIAGNTVASASLAAIYNTDGAAPVFRNSIIYGNTAGGSVKNIQNSSSTPVFTYSLVQGTSGGWTAFGTDGGNNIDANPAFAGGGNYTLQAGSPAVNAGNHLYYAANATPDISAIITDLAGNQRLSQKPDLGAYELSQPCNTPMPIAAAQTACAGQTLTALTAEGVYLKWYATAEAGTPLASNTALETGTYYVTQSFGTCESARLPVAVTVSTDPVRAYFRDADGDGFGQSVNYKMSCFLPEGYSENSLDCDDSNPAVTVCSNTFEPIQIRVSQCGTTKGFNTYIYAPQIDYATGYRFRINDGDQTYIIDTQFPGFKLNMLPVYSYDKTYQIEVAVFIDGVVTEYGDVCTIYSPSTPITQIKGTQCGTTISGFNTYIYANEVVGAQAYRFRVTSGANTQVVETAYKGFKLNMLSSYAYGATYTIDVAVQVEGEWSAYGPVCDIYTVSLPVTQIKAGQCGSTIPNNNTFVYAVEIAGAQAYRFRIFNGTSTEIYTSSTRAFKFKMLNSYSAGITYTIDVAVQIGGFWGNYGTPCNVTLGGGSFTKPGVTPEEKERVDTEISAYPNPFADSFKISALSSSDEPVNVQVFDLTGKLLDNVTMQPQELSSLRLGDRYAAGIYNVVVAQEGQQKLIKIVKQ